MLVRVEDLVAFEAEEDDDGSPDFECLWGRSRLGAHELDLLLHPALREDSVLEPVPDVFDVVELLPRKLLVLREISFARKLLREAAKHVLPSASQFRQHRKPEGKTKASCENPGKRREGKGVGIRGWDQDEWPELCVVFRNVYRPHVMQGWKRARDLCRNRGSSSSKSLADLPAMISTVFLAK